MYTAAPMPVRPIEEMETVGLRQTCDEVIDDIAKWIGATYKGSSRLIGMMATDTARANTAKTIIGSYGHTPVLNEMLDKVADGSSTRLSAVRDALQRLASSDEYRPQVAKYLEKRRLEVGFDLTNFGGVFA